MNTSIIEPEENPPGWVKPRLLSVGLVSILCAVGTYVYIPQMAYSRTQQSLVVDLSRHEVQNHSVEVGAEVAPAATVNVESSWPNLFGPAHNCTSQESVQTNWGPQGPAIAWEMPIGEGYSSPIVWKDRLIITQRVADEEVIQCLNVNDGQPIWEHRIPTTFVCQAKYTNGPYSTPATDGEFVFVLSAEGVLCCLNLMDGREIWKKDFREEYGYTQRAYGAGQGPLIWNEKLIINGGGRIGETGIVAFDKSTGELLWSATQQDAGYSTPQPAHIHGQDYLFVLTYDGIVSMNPDDGAVHWEIPWRSPISFGENAVTPVIYGDIALFSSYGNGSICMRILPDGSYETLWESNRSLTSQYTPLICFDNHVYGVHCADHSLRCIELTSGKIKWRKRTDLKRATAVHVGNELILFGEFGHLACLQLDSNACEIKSQTEESLFDDSFCFSSPALAGGKLFLRNEKKLLCLDIAAKP